jgi:hypothetical protein
MLANPHCFVAGANGPMLLEPIDRALDDVAVAIGGASEADAAARFGFQPRNDGADAAQLAAERWRSCRPRLGCLPRLSP